MIKQPQYILTNPNSGRHLYRRGWLGLIPLVGGFVGIGLMLLGLTRYRDRKLFFIGLAALLFTATIYRSLFYYIEYSEAGRKQFSEIAQDQMNSLVKDVEFYKLQNGQYPDSLEQVLISNRLAFIYDPLSSKNLGKSKKFIYQKLDNLHYTLFSVGKDMQENTKDDIYPSIDTAKIGLSKRGRG